MKLRCRVFAFCCSLTLLFSCALAEEDDGSLVRITTGLPAAEAVEEELATETDGGETPDAAAETAQPDEADAGAPAPSVTASPAAEETGERWADSQPFGIRHGPRDQKKVAVTMDDCYDRACIREIFDFCQELGVPMTFFPLGDQLKKKDAELWKAIAASNCEIGSHTNHHTNWQHMSYNGICIHLYRTQECLDEVLGYHYGMVSLRPPFGRYTNEKGTPLATAVKACNRYGYEHVVLWDVSQTNAELAKADVQNGSILLYHARAKDVKCLKTLIPWLIQEGYELVTVKDLLQLGEIEIGPEPYVHKKGE